MSADGGLQQEDSFGGFGTATISTDGELHLSK